MNLYRTMAMTMEWATLTTRLLLDHLCFCHYRHLIDHQHVHVHPLKPMLHLVVYMNQNNI